MASPLKRALAAELQRLRLPAIRVHHPRRGPGLPRVAGILHRLEEAGLVGRHEQEPPTGGPGVTQGPVPHHRRRGRAPYRGLGGNRIGKIIDTLLSNDLIIIDEVGLSPQDDTGAQMISRIADA